CLAWGEHQELYCASIGWSPVNGEDSVAEYLCNQPPLNQTIPVSETVTAYADALPTPYYSMSVRVPSGGPIPDLSIDEGYHVGISAVETAPAYPVVNYPYIAFLDAFCLPQGTEAYIECDGLPSGTDCYTDGSYYAEETEAYSQLVFYVYPQVGNLQHNI